MNLARLAVNFNSFQKTPPGGGACCWSEWRDFAALSWENFVLQNRRSAPAFFLRMNPLPRGFKPRSIPIKKTTRKGWSLNWSEWRDLNPRPLRPERSALPD